MRLDTVVLILAASLCSVPAVHGAEIGPGDSPACQLKLDGPIEAGDSDKLSAALEPLRSIGVSHNSLCLNSLGGNYDEALKLIMVALKRTNVATVVDRGAECYSACAFLFLAGNAQLSEEGELGPNRTLDVAGTLGFHAPYIQTAAGRGAGTPVATIDNFRRGVTAIAKLLEIDSQQLFPRGLLGKALQVGPDELLYVDTIEKVGVWSIKLKGYEPPSKLTSRMLDQACRNKDMWTNFSHTVLARAADDEEYLHGRRQSDFPAIRGSDDPIRFARGRYRETLDLFGGEASNNCIVDVFAGAKGALYLSLTMVAAEGPAEQPGPNPEELQQIILSAASDIPTLELNSDPLWYVYAPETPLMSLPRR